MSEKRRNGNIITTSAALVALGIGTAACGGSPAPAEGPGELPPVERYAHDYAGEYAGSTQSSERCLRGTAYDPFLRARTGGTPAAVILANEFIVVTPHAGDVLTLTNVGDGQPLQPANEVSQGILDAYGCSTEPYDQR